VKGKQRGVEGRLGKEDVMGIHLLKVETDEGLVGSRSAAMSAAPMRCSDIARASRTLGSWATTRQHRRARHDHVSRRFRALDDGADRHRAENCMLGHRRQCAQICQSTNSAAVRWRDKVKAYANAVNTV